MTIVPLCPLKEGCLTFLPGWWHRDGRRVWVLPVFRSDAARIATLLDKLGLSASGTATMSGRVFPS
jgi:hypothetical protein